MCRLAVTDETAHIPPTRTRQHIPSINCRLVHNDGRPGRFAVGNNGSNTAHCASVRSNRPVTAVVSTRSPVVSGSSWSMNRYRSTRSSSITDTPQPASPSCPLEPCGGVVDAGRDASTMSVTVKLAGSQGSVSLELVRLPERVDDLRTRGS